MGVTGGECDAESDDADADESEISSDSLGIPYSDVASDDASDDESDS
jgi:hypothetical protein